MRIATLVLSLAFSGAALAQTGNAAKTDKEAVKGAQQKAESQKPTDPQIAHIAATAHQIDIARGKMADKKSKNDEVKQFAEQMVNDHTAGLKEAVALCQKLGVKPQTNPVSKSLEAGAKKATAKLNKLKGKAFDKEYIDTEVAYHQAVIDAIKNTLIPDAQNDQLKQLLTDAVPTLEGHLQHAKNVQSQLGGSQAASK
jgi:putative membrane protein